MNLISFLSQKKTEVIVFSPNLIRDILDHIITLDSVSNLCDESWSDIWPRSIV